MQTQLIDRKSVQAKFSVTVPAADVDRAFQRTLQSIARQVKVPGFRPGKAPRGVLEQRVGTDAIAEEVREALVETYYRKAVQELELVPVHAHFHAHPPQEGNEYSFEVEVELYPTFELPDVSEIVIDTEVGTVNDTMVAQAIESLQRDHATLVPVERPVEAGDYLMIETASDGAGGTMPLDLERVNDEIVEQLLGKNIGDEIDLRFAGPEEADAEDDGGEETEGDAAAPKSSLKVIIRDIKAKEKPTADDEFAKTLGLETWTDVEERIRDSIRQQLERDGFEAQREEFIEKLVETTDVDLPESLVNRRKQNLLENLVQELRQKGGTLEGYLKELEEGGKRQEFDAELDEAARAGVKRDMVLERLLEQRGTKVTEEEFNGAIRYMAQRERKDVAKFRKDMGREGLANYRFLLTRDKAVREAVRELVGAPAGAAQDVVTESEAGDVAEAAEPQE